MPARILRIAPTAADLAPGFDRIRAEQRIPASFDPAAEGEAAAAAARGPRPPGGAPIDRRDLELVSIDPAGSRDLDQALHVAPLDGGGHRVSYAIADVAAMVEPGGALDAEARARGVTVYLPDERTPLHPMVLSEGAASLLPGEDRAALLWTIDLDGRGEPTAARLERALVRNRAALSYPEAQAAIDDGSAAPSLMLVREVGLRRLERETERGGVSLNLPAQVVARDGDGYVLRYEATLPLEDWNAQISLLAGICAAGIMERGGVGIFRTMPPPEEKSLEVLRRGAAALGVRWEPGRSYADVIRSLDPSRPGDAAFALRAARTLGGADYTVWRASDGGAPPAHGAIAATYAHVTAPLRRLVDRFANEIVVALSAGGAAPAWALDALDALPEVMRATTSRERGAERAAVDYVEAALLAGRVGERFAAVVVDARDGRPVVQIADPAVMATLKEPGPEPGTAVTVVLRGADPERRTVTFALA
ncbi:MAG: RNB domain-containing ribonuclease [Thermoleophilia bacterium]